MDLLKVLAGLVFGANPAGNNGNGHAAGGSWAGMAVKTTLAMVVVLLFIRLVIAKVDPQLARDLRQLMSLSPEDKAAPPAAPAAALPRQDPKRPATPSRVLDDGETLTIPAE